MTERSAPPEGQEPERIADAPNGKSASELAAVRDILFGEERRRLDELREKIERVDVTPQRLAETLPEAVFLRTNRDRQLAIALAPTVESAIRESVRKHPRQFASAIFPVLGPAIRKAISEAMANLVATVNASIGHTLSLQGLRWRVEAWRKGVPFSQIVILHSLAYRVEQALLIHAETGLLLSHAALPELITPDGDLISGMLTAIRDFVGDSFTEERDIGGLRRFSVGELTVIVEQGPHAVLAAVVRGEAPNTLLRKLQETLETVHLRYAPELTNFSGDTAPFTSAKELLDDLIETVLHDSMAAEDRRRAWLPWAALAVLAIMGLGFVWWQRAAHWRDTVARLEHEPGLVLVHEERGWRSSRLSGLRDPLAIDPSRLLVSIGVDTARVHGQWQPYVSLDPSMVIARARRQLTVPDSVVLTLVHDTLRATGSAPLAWVARAEGSSLLPAGVSSLDLTALDVRLPSSLVSAIADIEQRRVLFDLGSSVLRPSALASIDSNVARLRAIDSTLATFGREAQVELDGRADLTGRDSTNDALSGDRVERVRAVLTARGIPAPRMKAQALGTHQPLSTDDEAVRARTNRSVTFGIRVARQSASANNPRPSSPP